MFPLFETVLVGMPTKIYFLQKSCLVLLIQLSSAPLLPYLLSFYPC